MKHYLSIFLVFWLASLSKINAQSMFKVHFTYEKCAKERTFSFMYHDGEEIVPAKVTKLKNEYLVTGKLRTNYTYLQIDEKVDDYNNIGSRLIVNQIPAKVHYFKCDTSSRSYWKDIKLENAENLDIHRHTAAFKFAVNEYKSMDESNRNRIQFPDSVELKKKFEEDYYKYFDKQLEYVKINANSYASLFVLRDLIEEISDIKTDKYEETLKAFPSAIQNSPEGKLLLKTIQAKRYRFTNKPKIGKLAPAIETTDINGNKVNLKSLNGKYVLLVFWATWCAPCVKEIPQIMDIRKQYGPEKLEVISISQDEDKQKHKAFVKNKKMDWTQIVGVKSIVKDYFVNGIPETVLIDPMGKIVYINTGYDEHSLKKAIASFLVK